MLTRLNKAWTSYLTAGVFQTLASESRAMPWADDDDITAASLDLLYHGGHSGQKIVSPMVDGILESAETFTGSLTIEDKEQLATAIWALYHIKWAKLWATLSFEYNPIENYDRTETKTGTDTETETPTDWKETQTQTPTDWKETQTQTPTNWTETRKETPTDWKETVSGAAADNEAVTELVKWGFNSSDPVPDERSTTSAKNKQETVRSGSYETETERSGSYETETERSGSYETETERTGTYERETEYDTEIRVHGNIGVTTSQQMIESERELWRWDYFKEVFMDIDNVLTIDIY